MVGVGREEARSGDPSERENNKIKQASTFAETRSSLSPQNASSHRGQPFRDSPTANRCCGSATRRIVWFDAGSEQLTKPVGAEASVSGDASHGECVDRVVSWNGQNSSSVRHNSVLALTNHFEASLSECPDRLCMVDARNLRHAQTLTVTERTSSSFRFSRRTWRYS